MTHDHAERPAGGTLEARRAPSSGPTGALALQQSAGNQAVAALLARQERAGASPPAPGSGGANDDGARLARIEQHLATYDTVYLTDTLRVGEDDRLRMYVNWVIDLLTTFEMLYDGSPRRHEEILQELNRWLGLTHDGSHARIDSALNAMAQLRDAANRVVRNLRVSLDWNRSQQPHVRLWDDSLTYDRHVRDGLLPAAAQNRQAIEQGLSAYDARQLQPGPAGGAPSP